MTLDQAVNKAVNECIRDGILADFLRANKSEVIGVSIFEFDRDEYDDMVREESEEKGRAEGAYDNKVATARNLLAMKILSLEQIAEATQLSLSEVAAL